MIVLRHVRAKSGRVVAGTLKALLYLACFGSLAVALFLFTCPESSLCRYVHP